MTPTPALDVSPTQVAEWMQRDADQQRVIAHAVKDDSVVHIVFMSKLEKQTYCMVIRGGAGWLADFHKESGNVTVHDVTSESDVVSVREFYKLAIHFWPADQSIQRLQALLEFNS